MEDLLNKIRRKLLDEADRDQIITYAFKHRREASPANCRLMEERIRICIKVGGFRDPLAPGVPDQKVLKKLLPASKTMPILEGSIGNVWADLKTDLREITRKIMETNKDSLLEIKNSAGDEQEEKLLTIVEEMARKIADDKQYPVEEARLMLIYTIDQVLDDETKIDENEIESEEIALADESEAADEIPYYENVDLNCWLSQLQGLPAASILWDEVPTFIEKLNEITAQKIQERSNIKGLLEALDLIKQSYNEELEYFEFAGDLSWISGDIDPGIFLGLTNMAESLIVLFQHHLELRAGEGRDRTISEAEARRQAINDLEQEIKPLCKELSERLADHTKRADQCSPKKETELEEKDNPESLDDDDQTTPMGTEPEVELVETPEDQTDLGINQQEVSLIEEDNQDDIGNVIASATPDNNDHANEDNPVTSPADTTSAMHTETDEPDTLEDTPVDFAPEATQKAARKAAVDEIEQTDTDIQLSFELLVQQTTAASINIDELPRSWVLLKASRELYGERPELVALPTPALLELKYLSERIHRDPLLYSTHRKKLDSIAGEIKTDDLSPAQAAMHFAAALPLVLAHAYDPLKASLFYKDYIPVSFQSMYNTLSEYATKVRVPIIDLCGIEQSQNQNEEQQKRLGEQINQLFNQYTGTNKTSIDAFLFPKYGKGPLQWIRDGIQGGVCSDEFRTRLNETTAEDIFMLFAGKRANSVADQKLAHITAVRDNALDRINSILSLALAWAARCDEAKPIDDFHHKAFKQLQVLFAEHYEQWLEDLDEQQEELFIANCWVKQGLEQVFDYVRGVRSEVEFAG